MIKRRTVVNILAPVFMLVMVALPVAVANWIFSMGIGAHHVFIIALHGVAFAYLLTGIKRRGFNGN